MANYVQANLPNLKPRHYLLLANQTDHWFNAYPGVINDYRSRYRDDFCIVLWRSRKDDAYVLPYSRIKHLLVDQNLVGGPKNTLRWHGKIKGGHLALMGRRGESVSVGEFRNAFDLLTISSEGDLTSAQEADVLDAAEITFGLERDLQQALRSHVEQLEAGLRIVDSGKERVTEAGRIDITAQDRTGRTVVIELKAGKAAPEALTQLLAYIGIVSQEERRPARGILVAGDFHPRLVFASSAVRDVVLLRYRFNFMFETVRRDQ